ncbi:glycoside hydrolase family 3 N-terminal domain-containing protein [Candidatus Odyssella thessalonicensis]|uniref:glycoside hydrolase family 3 N-terminal domain-containing protein n=1 Tax=Candidatus Odyssella thessalonicensis TaxID=84647 RepID=UPI000225B925|nr:glycoside hydrolase family 3 N-terminal domain-containing protein [Candidatus Odyssella thessalonicensis]
MMHKKLLSNFKRLWVACCSLVVAQAAELEGLDRGQLERAVGQSIITGFSGKSPEDDGVESVCNLLKQGYVGGVILYAYNIENPEQLVGLTEKLKQADPQAIIAIDEEGGRVSRLAAQKGFPAPIPSALKVATTEDIPTAKASYAELAKMLKRHGINTNLGPVVDLHDSDSPAIGKLERSFSSDPDIVTAYAAAFIEAHHEHNLLTATKHAPGHGFARFDSHLGMTDITDYAKPEMELRPYYNLMEKGLLDMVMTAHVVNKHYDTEGYPATLSSKIIPPLFRDKGFDGVIISDALDMGAITKNYKSLEDAAALAFVKATCDMLILSNNPNATKDGTYSPNANIGKVITELFALKGERDEALQARLKESPRRIAQLKQRLL